MDMSTFSEIKYMNRLGFSKGRVYNWGWFQNTDLHTSTKITQSSPTPLLNNYRGNERVYKFEEQYINRSTFCEIKYMNRLFSLSVYVNCVQLFSLLQVVLIMLNR